jgi:hypothetical protein
MGSEDSVPTYKDVHTQGTVTFNDAPLDVTS